jgi:hypothetical protein
VSGGAPYRQNVRLKKVIKKYKIGKGKKSKKSEIPNSSFQPVLDIRSFQFTKKITTKKDKITKEKLSHGEVAVPRILWRKWFNISSKQPIPQAVFSYRVTNLRNNISGIHTSKVGQRIQFTQNMSKFFKYEVDDHLRFQFLRFLPRSLRNNFTEPITCLASFNKYNQGMFLVNVPQGVKDIVGHSKFNKGTFIHGSANGYHAVGRLYEDKTIAFSPTSLGLSSSTPSFVGEFTIISPRLTAQEANFLTNQSRARFVKEHLGEIQEVTEIQFTGVPSRDKEKMGKLFVPNLVNNGHIEGIKSIHYDIHKFIPDVAHGGRDQLKPDAVVFLEGEENQIALCEFKFFAKSTEFSQSDINQLRTYKETGYYLILLTTKDRNSIHPEVKEIPDRIIAYDEILKAIQQNGKEINKTMLYKVRESWPRKNPGKFDTED